MAEEAEEINTVEDTQGGAQSFEEYKAACDKYVTQADKQMDQLIERHKLSGQEFDKQLVAIAGGGLALTITLTKDLLTKDDSGFIWLLYLSWLFFVICLSVNLFSHRTASNHYNLMIDRLSHIREATAKYQEAQIDYVSELTRKIDTLTPRLNRVDTIAWVSCMAGIGLFIIFITTNRYLHDDRPAPRPSPSPKSAAGARSNKGAPSNIATPHPAVTASTTPAGHSADSATSSRQLRETSRRIDK